MGRLLAVALVGLWGCKARQYQEAEARARSSTSLVAQGREELARGRTDRAIEAFKQAISATPQDVRLYLQLAEAYQRAGNQTAAVLTLKQAEQVGGQKDPTLQRARADLYLEMHQVNDAVRELRGLRDAELLTDGEVLELARLEAHAGKLAEAFATLGVVQQRSPDDVEAKVVEAEILLLRGDELLSAKIMDRLLADAPTLTSARLLRARYFLANGRADLADKDLQTIGPEDSKRLDVVTLRVRALREVDRSEAAEQLVAPLLAADPANPELLALHAEILLGLGQTAEAQKLVDQVLAKQPRQARALYVRGRASEAQKDLVSATADYEASAKYDPTFAPPLSRLWRLSAARDDKQQTMEALEKLLYLNEITADEKVALAALYADTGADLPRGKKLIEEALRRDPKREEYKKIQKRLAALSAGPKKAPAVIIMRGRH